MAQLIAKIEAVTEDSDWLYKHWGRPVERIFYIYDVPENTERGFHSHRDGTMGLICLSGSVDIYIQMPHEDQHFRLNLPYQLLIIDPTDWRIMYNFSADAILMVLADCSFSETIYVTTPYRELVD